MNLGYPLHTILILQLQDMVIQKTIEVFQVMIAAEQQKFPKQQFIVEELFTVTMLLFLGKS
jgi:hypothetical protein